MCGIAGFFARRPVSPEIAAQMLAALKQRGPDGQHAQLWEEDFRPAKGLVRNALLHTRLAIRDPRPQADQPMVNSERNIWICYNGEVYGWEAEAAALQRSGTVFRTHSDTEFVLHAYQAWGLEALVARLRGMFALAILDLNEKKLHLVRDRMGLKPLVYHFDEGDFAFGSTVRAVLPFVPGAKRSFSAAGLDAYLAHRYIPAPLTVFTAIRRLENGHMMSFDLRSRTLTQQRYWHPRALANGWKPALDEAVALRTASDRPVGLFLSSGVDSTVIACKLSELGYRNIATFTAAFPGTTFDESEEAAQTAAGLGMRNTRVEIQLNVGRDFPSLVRDLDEPFADPSVIPTWYLAGETVKHATVVLGGDGGDELFAGYKRYRQHLRSAWRRGLRLPVPRGRSLRPGKLGKLLGELSMPWEHAYALRFSGFAPWQRAYLQPGLALMPDVYWRMDTAPELAPREALLQIDLDNYLPEYILRKGDLCTMAHGLELRAPLLDHVLYQHLLALPPAARFTTPPKRLLIDAAPQAKPVLQRKKRGFNPPLAQWLRQDLANRIPGLGRRLGSLSGGQLAAQSADELGALYRSGEERFAEQLLQLLILDESLSQLAALAAKPQNG